MKRTGKFGGNNMSNFYSEEEGGDSEKLLLVDE